MSFILLFYKLDKTKKPPSKYNFTYEKLRISLAVNILLVAILYCCYHSLFFVLLSLGGGLLIGETIFFGHGWRPIDEKIKNNIVLERLICATSHITYAFLACMVFILINNNLFEGLCFNQTIGAINKNIVKECIMAFFIGCTIPTIPFLN